MSLPSMRPAFSTALRACVSSKNTSLFIPKRKKQSQPHHYEAKNPNFAEDCKSILLSKGFLHAMGAQFSIVEPGFVEMRLPFQTALSQQHGFFHGGLIGTLSENTGIAAALTLLPAGGTVQTVEFKINLVAPGKGDVLVAQGHVVKAGKTLTLTRSEVFVETAGQKKLVAAAQGTLFTLDSPDKAHQNLKAPEVHLNGYHKDE